MIWLALLAACTAPPDPPMGHGVSLGLFASDVRYDYGPLLQEIHDLGADEVALAVPWSLPTTSSAALRSDVPRDVVQRTMRQASSLGLHITVMPVITLASRPTGEWRGTLSPTDPGLFWTNYDSLLRPLALDAQRAGAHRFVVGSELCSLESNDAAWRERIHQVRAVFDGRVTYSANWDHYQDIAFWDALDEVGMTAYFPVDTSATDQWRAALTEATTLADRVDRPLIITEYGYPPLATAASQPWDETTGDLDDTELQAALYDVALTTLRESPVHASFAWSWFGTGEAGAAEFSPRGRPAADVLRHHFHLPNPNE